MGEVIMLASGDRCVGTEIRVQRVVDAQGGKAPTTRRQRYDRDARYAAIPARRSSAL